jgi:peptidoglycan/xylan/chitin deacetylase (PgdA/CDA1 family)
MSRPLRAASGLPAAAKDGAAPGLLPTLAQGALSGLMALGSPRDRLSIFIYHRVLAAPDPLFPDEIDARRFEQQLALIQRHFRLLPLADAAAALRAGTLPARAACITFDDGYADNADIALPILQRHGAPATFFVASGFLNGGRMWNDTVIELVRRVPKGELDLRSLGYGSYPLDDAPSYRGAIFALIDALKYVPLWERQAKVDQLVAHVGLALPDDLMMSSDQVRLLHRSGMEIGGHTVNHPIIARLDSAAAYSEIVKGKQALEELIGTRLRLFAYPNGKPGQDYLAEHVAMVKQLGFEAAVSTSWGAASRASDPFQLPRFTPWDHGQLRFLLRLMQNLRRNGETV